MKNRNLSRSRQNVGFLCGNNYTNQTITIIVLHSKLESCKVVKKVNQKISYISYQERQRDWPYEASATGS